MTSLVTQEKQQPSVLFDHKRALHIPDLPRKKEEEIIDMLSDALRDGLTATKGDGQPDHDARLKYFQQAVRMVGVGLDARTEVMAQATRAQEVLMRHEEEMSRIEAGASAAAGPARVDIFSAGDHEELERARKKKSENGSDPAKK